MDELSGQRTCFEARIDNLKDIYSVCVLFRSCSTGQAGG